MGSARDRDARGALSQLSSELIPLFASSLEMAKGFDPSFDGIADVEDLFEELNYLNDQNFAPLSGGAFALWQRHLVIQ